MNKERLDEIKDSINFQYELIVSKGIDKSALLFTDEEQELLKEVERLNNIINEIYMFLSQYTITHTWQKIVIEDTIKYIEELKGSGSNEQK